MSHLLPLSRVAKLVGQPRHALQEMIRGGTLATFDGMVELDELLRVFPEVKWDDDAEFRRVQEIKDKAFAKRVLERALPDKDVLVARLNELGDDYAAAKALLLHYGNVMTWLDEKIEEIEEDTSAETRHALHTVRAFLLRNLAEVPPDAVLAQAAIAQERIFKIMSAHVTIQPSGHEFYVDGNDTLLEAALRNGVSLNYGCSNGNCGECKARVLSGEVKKVHAHDYVLKAGRKRRRRHSAVRVCAGERCGDRGQCGGRARHSGAAVDRQGQIGRGVQSAHGRAAHPGAAQPAPAVSRRAERRRVDRRGAAGAMRLPAAPAKTAISRCRSRAVPAMRLPRPCSAP